nr:TolC family outer membrane protein [Methylomarinum sp. Ch1-1]MDP4520711.1 TolC family outer membrane protein [Methylomarinum sp. Ch1-1]
MPSNWSKREQRFEVGLIAITDVYEAQAAYDQARANEIEAANLLDDAKEGLRELIGDNQADLNPLHEKIILNRPEPDDISLWANSAQNNNFNIVAQLNQAEVARKEIRLQQSAHLPTIDIVANYNVQDNTSTFGLRGDTQSVGLQLNLPIFEGGGVYSRTQQAQYDYQREKEDLTKVKRTVTRQVRNAYRGVLASLSRVKALTATVKSSQSALEASEAGLEVGTRTMVDVLAEQRNLFRSKRDYARSRYDYLINGIKLKEAAGSLSEADLQEVNKFLQR